MAANDINHIKVPRYIDDPPRFLLWRVDEILPLMIALCTGFIVGQLIICTFVGIILVKFYKKFNKNNQDGFPLHVLYWFGYIKGRGRTFVNPFIRRFYP